MSGDINPSDDAGPFKGAPTGLKITFAAETGPRLGTVSLLTKASTGFAVPPATEIDALLRKVFVRPMDCSRFRTGLTVVAQALNSGDLALAAIATAQLRLRPAIELSIRKAGVDDPAPGWPAKTPGSLGGKFRPEDEAISVGFIDKDSRAARIARLSARRSFRAVLHRLLTAKRLARLVLEGLGEFVPGLDLADTAAMAEDITEIAGEITENKAEVDAAVDFVEKGPKTLEELEVTTNDRTFPSYDAFKKIDPEFEKVFGSAGPGYEYHHIVEQSAALDGIPLSEINSTSNIIRIPKFLHELINGYYSQIIEGTGGMTLRESLKGASFATRRKVGLDALRHFGVLYP